MIVEIKEWETLDKKGHPRAFFYNRIVHGGDIFSIPDTLVVHEIDSDVEFEKDGKNPKKERLITHFNVRVSANPNADTVEMTEYEHRLHTIKTSPMARRWGKEDKELFLKYYWYSPEYMKPANRGAQPNIDPEDSMPTKWGRNIPTVTPGANTSVGDSDTGEFVGKLTGMTDANAVRIVNKTSDASKLNMWLEYEKALKGGGREKVMNAILTQLKTASGG
jgi:hypothetical protein